MSTNRLTERQTPALHFLFMASEKKKREPISMRPLLKWLEDSGSNQAEFARLIGESDQVLTNWKARGIPGHEVPKIALQMGITTDEYLARAKSRLPSKKNISLQNTQEGPEIRAKVPVISWARAGTWSDIEDPFAPGEAEEWIPTTKIVSPSAFALRVVGDSMEPTIPAGSIVIIDPGAHYAHGKIVLAKRTQDQQATLKQLWYDGGTPMLKPLNPRYPIMEMPADTRVIGVAVKLELDL